LSRRPPPAVLQPSGHPFREAGIRRSHRRPVPTRGPWLISGLSSQNRVYRISAPTPPLPKYQQPHTPLQRTGWETNPPNHGLPTHPRLSLWWPAPQCPGRRGPKWRNCTRLESGRGPKARSKAENPQDPRTPGPAKTEPFAPPPRPARRPPPCLRAPPAPKGICEGHIMADLPPSRFKLPGESSYGPITVSTMAQPN